LVSLAILVEANQTNEKEEEEEEKRNEADVCPQNARNQVRYTIYL